MSETAMSYEISKRGVVPPTEITRGPSPLHVSPFHVLSQAELLPTFVLTLVARVAELLVRGVLRLDVEL